jgi:hypothetical protein
MSYHRDLEELEESELRKELERRQTSRDLGLCDYCGRDGDTPPCKFPERHRVAAELLVGRVCA